MGVLKRIVDVLVIAFPPLCLDSLSPATISRSPAAASTSTPSYCQDLLSYRPFSASHPLNSPSSSSVSLKSLEMMVKYLFIIKLNGGLRPAAGYFDCFDMLRLLRLDGK